MIFPEVVYWRGNTPVRGFDLTKPPAASQTNDVAQAKSPYELSAGFDTAFFKSLSTKQLVQYFLANFEKFTDPYNKEFITNRSLFNVLYPTPGQPVRKQDTDFVMELAARHSMPDLLDAGGDGHKEGNINRASLRKYLDSAPYEYGLTDESLSRYLQDNFEKFAGPENRVVTRDSLLEAAKSKGNGRFTESDVKFAKAFLLNESLMNKFDQDAQGRLDGEIDRENIRLVVNPATKYENSYPYSWKTVLEGPDRGTYYMKNSGYSGEWVKQ